MIKIPGQLVIRTLNGRYGYFNVGRLITSIGEFAVKNAELDQYSEGKYDGEFIINRICQTSYSTNGRFVFEMRAVLGSMELSNIDNTSKIETNKMESQDIDPIEEEMPRIDKLNQQQHTPSEMLSAKVDEHTSTPIKDGDVQSVQKKSIENKSEKELFGVLWL